MTTFSISSKASLASSEKGNINSGFFFEFATSTAFSAANLTPFPLNADVSTTGQLTIFDCYYIAN